MKGGDDWRVWWGVGTEVAAKAPINTLIAAWPEQAVPVNDTLGLWRGGGGKFPTGRHTPIDNRTVESRNHSEVFKKSSRESV